MSANGRTWLTHSVAMIISAVVNGALVYGFVWGRTEPSSADVADACAKPAGVPMASGADLAAAAPLASIMVVGQRPAALERVVVIGKRPGAAKSGYGTGSLAAPQPSTP